MIKAVRGTRDLLPPDTGVWNYVESVVREVFRAYNFQEIRTPIFESTELFARGVGEETDIVSKEMFTWFDDQRSIETKLEDVFLSRLPKNTEQLAPAIFPALEYQPRTWLVRSQGKNEFVDYSSNPSSEQLERLRRYGDIWKNAKGQVAKLRLVTDRRLPNIFRLLARDFSITVTILDPRDSKPAQSLTLRPENTAGTVRAYIEHKLWDRGLNKLYYIGPQFRRERPQKGRYRQFYQIGAEVIGPPSSGSESPARDAELLEMLATLLDRLGITGWTLELNSVGSSAERVKFNQALQAALEPVKDKLCGDCQRRAVTNPLRVLDCKVPADQPIIDTLPRISQFLEEDSRKHFAAVQKILQAVGVPFTLNDRLVRGLDYYTRTAFEFTHGALGAQNAILGGGRYDGLAEVLGSPQPAPGIGFAIGEDRLVMSLQESAAARAAQKVDVYIAPMTDMNIEAAKLARELRRELVVELGDENFKLKKSFEAATKAGAKYILIVGENEVRSGAFALKHLESGQQVQVPRAELVEKIKS